MAKNQKAVRTTNKSRGPTASRKSKPVALKQAKPPTPPQQPTPGVQKSKPDKPTQSFIVRGTVELMAAIYMRRLAN